MAGIDVKKLVAAVTDVLADAAERKHDMGAVNWADLRVADVESVSSLLCPDDRPGVRVLIEEADSRQLEQFLYDRLWPEFEPVEFVTEW